MKRLMSLLATALLLGAGFQSFALPAEADEQGWGLLVNSPHVGKIYVYVTGEGFAISLPKTGAKFVTHAPDWRVIIYNDKTHVYYVERMEDLEGLTKSPKARQATQAGRKATVQQARKGTTRTIAGCTSTQYFINTYSAEGGAKQAEAWISNQLHPPRQLSMTLGKIFGIDTSAFPDGMPMQVILTTEGGRRENIYDTVLCQPQTIRSASFNYPPSYTRVDNELAVLVDEKSRKKMETILDDSEDLDTLLSTPGAAGSSGGSKAYSSNNRSSSNYGSAYTGGKSATAAGTMPTNSTGTGNGGTAKNGDFWNSMLNQLGGKK